SAPQAAAAPQGPVTWKPGTVIPLDRGDQGFAVALSPDGKTVASGRTKAVVLCETTTGKERTRFEQPLAFAVPFSPDGALLATGHRAPDKVILWDPATGQERATLLGHQQNVGSVAWSPDGKTLASSSADGAVILWDVEGTLATGQGKELRRLA